MKRLDLDLNKSNILIQILFLFDIKQRLKRSFCNMKSTTKKTASKHSTSKYFKKISNKLIDSNIDSELKEKSKIFFYLVPLGGKKD